MEYDQDKVDEMVLALLRLTTFGERAGLRAWERHDWDALDRLHRNPRGNAKSVVVSEKGAKRSRELFEAHFGSEGRSGR